MRNSIINCLFFKFSLFLEKSHTKIWSQTKKRLPLHSQFSNIALLSVENGIWCNGNTTDSGPVILGSSPSIPTSFGCISFMMHPFLLPKGILLHFEKAAYGIKINENTFYIVFSLSSVWVEGGTRTHDIQNHNLTL